MSTAVASIPELLFPAGTECAPSDVLRPDRPLNAVAMPAVVDKEKLVMELVFRGTTYDDVMVLAGVTKEQIRKIVSSEEFRNVAMERAQSADPESLRKLLQVAAFAGGIRVLELIGSKNETIALKASEIALNMTIAPAKQVDVGRMRQVLTEDQAQKEMELVQKKLSDINKRLGKTNN